MTLPWRELAEARVELAAAALWLERERAGAGYRLIDEVDGAIKFITDWPNASREAEDYRTDPPVRSRGLRVNPYNVVYTVSDGVVVIVAYAHFRQPPGYWTRRLNDLA